jgi:hypothetical protein
VPVLPDVVDRDVPLRLTAPEVTCELPKVRMVLAHARSLMPAL